jgi:hypothetical protein
MPEYPSTCVLCRAAGVIDWPDFGAGDRDPEEGHAWRAALPDEAYQEQTRMDEFVESVESRIKSGRHEHLCAACHDRVEAKYRRGGRSWRGTLAEVLQADDRRSDEMLLEAVRQPHDPDVQLVRDLFPGVAVPQPARAKSRRSEAAGAALLECVGKPVAYFDPARAEEGEDPYILYVLNEAGEVCVDYLGACDLVTLGEVACALDYAADGTLQEGRTGA